MNRGITSFQFKIIGIILMVFDHIHQMFYFAGVPNWFTMLGRPVATMFILLSVEGVVHTRNIYSYMKRLLIAFWLMCAASLVIQKLLPSDVILLNSILGTLFLCVLLMVSTEKIVTGVKDRDKKALCLGVAGVLTFIMLQIVSFLLMIAGGSGVLSYLWFFVPSLFSVEGSILIFMSIPLYLFRKHRMVQCLVIMVFSLLLTGFDFNNLYTTNIQWMMVFSIIPLLLYNGQIGRKTRYFFYIFYPAHIYILYIMSYMLASR
ncbi:TraX family protein [Lacrimispora sp.]|uniref:TraX family protein n=1 Tax=Lacrimispora sp. TaxID=2719234 RepID=UPI0028A7F771|nr:TraX family protein [Lacrimispora sp.]